MSAAFRVICWSVCLLAAPGCAMSDDLRAFTVADSIGMTRFARMDRDYLGGERSRIGPSPEGRHVLVLTRTGILDENVNEFVLWMYRMDEIRAAFSRSAKVPQPIELARFKSRSNAEAIRHVTWDAAGRSVFFVAEGIDGIAQLYRCDVTRDGARPVRLTDEPLGVRTYSANDRAAIYSAELPRSSHKEQLLQSEGFVLPHDWSGPELLNPRALDHPTIVPHAGTFMRHVGLDGTPTAARVRVAEDLHDLSDFGLDYWLAPDGRRAVALRVPKSVPKTWERHPTDPSYSHSRIRAGKTGRGSIARQYVLIDTTTGTIAPIFDAPVGTVFNYRMPLDAVWSANGQSVILTNTFVPVEARRNEVRSAEGSPPAIVAYDVSTRAYAVLRHIPPLGARDDRLAIEWDPSDRGVRIKLATADGNEQVSCHRRGRSWTTVACSALAFRSRSVDSGPVVEIEENLNTPPRLIARDPRSKRSVVILGPNPQLSKLSLARVEKMTWKDSTDREWHGAFYHPVGKAGRSPAQVRYPLVIQTHGDRGQLDTFMVDGPTTSAYAAQALANRGIAVLHVQDGYGALTPDEPRINVRGYEAGIDHLDRQGLIDRERVGIIGWSRTVYYVLYALTHSAYPIRAATVSDGVDLSYLQFLWRVGGGEEGLGEGKAIYGALPYGEGLASWAKESPGFNLDRVRAPLRLEAYRDFNAFVLWEAYAGLRILDKPVEMIVIPRGVHSLVKPRERFFSQQGNVDWFAFWLKEEEDPAPGKAEQYQRWRELRAKQQGQATR